MLPQGNGPYSVGSMDVMTDPSPVGSFFRLFYPIKKWNMDRVRDIQTDWDGSKEMVYLDRVRDLLVENKK